MRRRATLLLVVFAVGSVAAATVRSGSVTGETRQAGATATRVALGAPHDAAFASYSRRTRPAVGAPQPDGRQLTAPAVARGARAGSLGPIAAASGVVHALPGTTSVKLAAVRAARKLSRMPAASSLATAAVLPATTPSADAYVQSDVPNSNFGTGLTLNNVSGAPEARAYLKFDLTGVSGTITKATFRVFAQNSSGSGYELHTVADNSWTEAALNYTNRPLVGALIGSAANFATNSWTTVDVTSVVKTAGTYSFEMNATSTTLKKYASRESGANAPQLVLETAAAAVPAAVAVVAGSSPQSAQVNAAYGVALAAKVTDASAQPVAGVTVTFTAPASGASGVFAGGGATVTAVTGANGVATAPQFTANATAGAFAVSASVSGVSPAASFSLTNTAASGPTSATILASADGYVQSDLPSTNFGTSAVLKNTTSPDTRAYLKFNLSGISGTVTKVTFRAFTQTSSGSGYELHQVADNSWVEPGLTYTNRPAVGVTIGSAVNFTANTWTSVDVSSYVRGNGTFSFEMNGTSTSLKQYSSRQGANPAQLVVEYTPAVTPAALSATAGSGQSATVGTAFAAKLSAKAVDGSGNPASGVVVTFTAPASGAGGAFAGGATTATATTGSDGVATSPQFTANATPGSYQVRASASGVASPATFDLTNVAAPPPSTPTGVVTADSYVRSDVPAGNYGTSTVLIARTSPEIDAYVKFDVTGLGGSTPAKAVLRLWAETTGTTTYKVYQVVDNSWTESGLTFTNKPAFGGLLATSGATTAGTWMDVDVTSAVQGNGPVTLGFTSGTTAGKNFGAREDFAHAPQLLLTGQPPTNGDPVIVAAGDIACSPADANYNGGLGTATACHEKATSDLVLSLNPLAVLTLGDEQYNSGKLTDFLTSYDPTWGRFKGITHPAIGNHEFGDTGASGYFNYFGDNATPLQPGCRTNCKAWYSYDVGNWHIITLNTECTTNNNNCVVGSEQELWLKSELAKANAAGQCKLVTSHHPKWSSSSFAATDIDPLIQDMYAGHTDIYLAGHMHGYERFAPQTPSGALDPTGGITQIISGGGGAFFTGFSAIQPNSVVHNNDTYGVLKLVLHPHSADYQYVRDPTSGLFSDSGTLACH
ncbi:MAG: hypothetical protein QOI71_477 [Gaiellales bacterium]|nr:hypothetical protein [Gaiellales bacterium]